MTTSIALLVVELFEVTNGFGVMTNVYDPADFVANALGVGLALALDWGLHEPGEPHDSVQQVRVERADIDGPHAGAS